MHASNKICRLIMLLDEGKYKGQRRLNSKDSQQKANQKPHDNGS